MGTAHPQPLRRGGDGGRKACGSGPRPACVGAEVPLLRWLQAFPSYGFLLSVRPAQAGAVAARFAARGLACADIGTVTPGPEVGLHAGAERALLWDLSAETFIAARTEAAHA